MVGKVSRKSVLPDERTEQFQIIVNDENIVCLTCKKEKCTGDCKNYREYKKNHRKSRNIVK